MTNTFIDTLVSRRSVRSYWKEQIKKEELDSVLKAGLYAASGMGKQSAVLVAVQDKALRDKLSKMNADVMKNIQDPFYGAPTVIAVLADSTIHTWQEDGALAIGNMLAAAHSIGLGSCWIHRAREIFDSNEGKSLLKEWGLSENYKGVGFCILGYIDKEAPAAVPRREGRVIYKL